MGMRRAGGQDGGWTWGQPGDRDSLEVGWGGGQRRDGDGASPLCNVSSDRYKGVKKGGVTENASYYIFTQCPDGAFEAFPVQHWYNFTPLAKHRTLTAEEAEEEWERSGDMMGGTPGMSWGWGGCLRERGDSPELGGTGPRGGEHNVDWGGGTSWGQWGHPRTGGRCPGAGGDMWGQQGCPGAPGYTPELEGTPQKNLGTSWSREGRPGAWGHIPEPQGSPQSHRDIPELGGRRWGHIPEPQRTPQSPKGHPRAGGAGAGDMSQSQGTPRNPVTWSWGGGDSPACPLSSPPGGTRC